MGLSAARDASAPRCGGCGELRSPPGSEIPSQARPAGGGLEGKQACPTPAARGTQPPGAGTRVLRWKAKPPFSRVFASFRGQKIGIGKRALRSGFSPWRSGRGSSIGLRSAVLKTSPPPDHVFDRAKIHSHANRSAFWPTKGAKGRERGGLVCRAGRSGTTQGRLRRASFAAWLGCAEPGTSRGRRDARFALEGQAPFFACFRVISWAKKHRRTEPALDLSRPRDASRW